MQYKTVLGTANFLAPSRAELENSVSRLADTINREATGGWEFYGMYPMSAEVDHSLSSNFAGRALGRFAGEDGQYTVNVMVFRKY